MTFEGTSEIALNVLAAHAIRLQERIDGLQAALTTIQAGVDHPDGIEAPEFYRAVEWAQRIAYAALEEFGA